MTFKPGQSGNPGGRPKAEKNIQQIARQHGPAAIKALVDALTDPKLKVAAANALLDRGYGKAPQFNTANVADFRKAMEMSDDELAGIIASGRSERATETPADSTVIH